MMRLFGLSLCLLLLVISSARAEDKPLTSPPSSPDPIAVTEADTLLWERYQLLQRLADAQLQALRLQNEKTLSDEYAKLDARFRAHYHLPVDAIERRGEQWIPRPTAPPTTPK